MLLFKRKMLLQCTAVFCFALLLQPTQAARPGANETIVDDASPASTQGDEQKSATDEENDSDHISERQHEDEVVDSQRSAEAVVESHSALAAISSADASEAVAGGPEDDEKPPEDQVMCCSCWSVEYNGGEQWFAQETRASRGYKPASCRYDDPGVVCSNKEYAIMAWTANWEEGDRVLPKCYEMWKMCYNSTVQDGGWFEMDWYWPSLFRRCLKDDAGALKIGAFCGQDDFSKAKASHIDSYLETSKTCVDLQGGKPSYKNKQPSGGNDGSNTDGRDSKMQQQQQQQQQNAQTFTFPPTSRYKAGAFRTCNATLFVLLVLTLALAFQ